MKKVAFVVPWYSQGMTGGAEFAYKNIAIRLKEKGVPVEILTTCVKEFTSDWNKNYFNEGTEEVEGMTIRRFEVKHRDTRMFDSINYKLINNMFTTNEEQQIFMDEMINSPKLYEYIKYNSDDYQCYIYIPYMFGTTYYGIKACPEKSILIPCLHDESYAYMDPIKELFQMTKGIIYLSQAESELAESIYNIKDKYKQVIGVGIEDVAQYDGGQFKMKYNLTNPFILYAGRKDAGKKVDLLLEYFRRFIKSNSNVDLELVLIGGGDIDISKDITHRVHDLGYLPMEDKYNAYKAATLFCNPSQFESFSIVIMESWYAGTPVMVNGKCEVTKQFCINSNGGFYFNNYFEFEEIIKTILNNEDIRDIVGKQGKKFAKDNFLWETVINKYIYFINNISC